MFDIWCGFYFSHSWFGDLSIVNFHTYHMVLYLYAIIFGKKAIVKVH